jgi:hypothetical protein
MAHLSGLLANGVAGHERVVRGRHRPAQVQDRGRRADQRRRPATHADPHGPSPRCAARTRRSRRETPAPPTFLERSRCPLFITNDMSSVSASG